jgi:hypothetical protein
MALPRRATKAILVPILSPSLLGAADFSCYHGFQFGTKLAAAAKQAGAKLSWTNSSTSGRAVIQGVQVAVSQPRTEQA